MIENRIPSPVEAAKAKPQSPERVAFLKACADMGDFDRIRAVGEFLSIVFNVPIPSRPVTFNWGKFSKTTAENLATPRKSTDNSAVMNLVPRGTSLVKGKAQPVKAPSQVAEEYILTIDGESLHFGYGSQTVSEFSPKLGRNIVRVAPSIQLFKNRLRTIDPFTNLVEYLFFWMHPTNVGAPSRFSPDEQKRAGVTVAMESKYYLSHILPTISSGLVKKQAEKDIEASRESIEMTSRLQLTDEATLKRWAKLTGFDSGKYVHIERMADAYRSHLNKVVNNQMQTVLDATYKERLRTLMQEEENTTKEIVMEAIEKGFLVMDDLEWYADKKDDNGPVPFIPLAKYMVPQPQEETAAEWLCIELDRRRDTKAISEIEMLVQAYEPKVATVGGRTVSADIVDAIHNAIANESIKVVRDEAKRYVWVNSRNEEVVKTKGGQGVTKKMQVDALLLWASSVSDATVLANIFPDGDNS